ncbi:MAG: hypothetical protein KGI00_00545 [Candidatus Micrarchaeota archaeon]|nr:hypothetical protein [Candidatus Micrarchaeota archaeon]MDE1849201.1 hypothetical protein [Candidatus Micrarchaeota archaeon]
MENRLDIYESDDKRLRTGTYSRNGMTLFCLAERTALGSLITEFTAKGEIANQVYKRGGEPMSELDSYLGNPASRVVKVGAYQGITIDAKCQKCGRAGIRRELDSADPSSITNVPVMPTLKCAACGQRFYSITNNYIRNLVESNVDLFTKDELAEKAKDEGAFIKLLNEYIIRIFASKKISRI